VKIEGEKVKLSSLIYGKPDLEPESAQLHCYFFYIDKYKEFEILGCVKSEFLHKINKFYEEKGVSCRIFIHKIPLNHRKIQLLSDYML